MNDFERALSDALKKASDDYRPTDQFAAKERFLHRLRRRQLFFVTGGVALAGSAAVVAGLLVFARDTTPTQRAEPLPPAAALDEAPAQVAVGERPSGVAFGDDHVWVANAGDGSVMIIDPATRAVVRTIEVGGDPDDVAVGVGAAWVSDAGAGTVTALPLPSHEVQNEPVTLEVGEPGSVHMDVAPGADGLWIAKDDSLFRLDPMSFEYAAINSVEGPTDVAVGEGSVYVLGTNEIARVDPESLISSHVADIRPSRNQDLAFRDGYLWIANGDDGEVTRLDPETGESSNPIYVGGNFSGIAVDEDAVWVISGGASETGVLTRIDPDTLAVSGSRAELSGRPYDITTGAGFVWIANQSAGTVSGLSPDALPGAVEGPDESGNPVVVFAADGDLWIETFQGRLTRLTDDIPTKRDPTVSPDATHVAFERDAAADTGSAGDIVVRNLATGEETQLGPGTDPEFAPDGRLAWIDHHRGFGRDRIAIAHQGEDPSFFEPVAASTGPVLVSDLTWDLDGTYLYYNVSDRERVSLYQADPSGQSEPFELIPGNHREGASYLAPSVRTNGGVHVVRTCCGNESDELEAEIGIIRFTEGGPQYEGVVALDPRQLPAEDISELDSAGNLTLEVVMGDRRWRHTVDRSWFVATDQDIWLVSVPDEPGILDAVYVSDAFFNDLGDFRVAGLETFPDFDD